ncbi:MAG: DUF4406 domain-containing protein [Bacillota bacterium]
MSLYCGARLCACRHLIYPQLLDDNIPAQRVNGTQMGLRVLASCDELWICGERISHGMSCEIAEAERLGIPIRNLSTEQIHGGSHMKKLCLNPKEREFMPEETPSCGMNLHL